MYGTQLHPYSIGIAAENKPLDTNVLNVVPIEQMSALDGEIVHSPESVTAVGIDSEGNRYEVTTTQAIALSCEWIPFGSNRVTSPDIRRGELIEIWQLGDSDQFYWRSYGLRDHLRRLETVIYAFNANPDETPTNKLDVQNCYYLEISTHQGLITLGTSKKNGEPYAYTIQLNTKDGVFSLVDDIGNFLELVSDERLIKVQNADESMIEIDKDRVRAQDAKGDYLELVDDHIRAENSSGSHVDIQGDIIRVENSTGTYLDIEGDALHAENVTGSFLNISGANILANAAGGVVIQSGSTSMAVTPNGIAMDSVGTSMSLEPGSVKLKTSSFDISDS